MGIVALLCFAYGVVYAAETVVCCCVRRGRRRGGSLTRLVVGRETEGRWLEMERERLRREKFREGCGEKEWEVKGKARRGASVGNNVSWV